MLEISNVIFESIRRFLNQNGVNAVLDKFGNICIEEKFYLPLTKDPEVWIVHLNNILKEISNLKISSESGTIIHHEGKSYRLYQFVKDDIVVFVGNCCGVGVPF